MNKPESTLIYDRTIQDVARNLTKGNYNYTDLNRLEEWCSYLAELLKENGYYINITTYTDWNVGIGKEKMQSNMNRIRSNIKAIKDGFFYFSHIDFDEAKTSVNYIDANKYEKLLANIDTSIANMIEGFRYANFLIAGDDLGMPNVEN